MSNQSQVNDKAPDQVSPDGFQTPIDPTSRKSVDKMSTDGRSSARSDAQPGSGVTHQEATSAQPDESN